MDSGCCAPESIIADFTEECLHSIYTEVRYNVATPAVQLGGLALVCPKYKVRLPD